MTDLKAITLLLVEDEEELCRRTAVFLRRSCGTVLTAANGAAALEIVAQRRPDVVVSDIRMPVMDGIELALQASSAFPTLKILLMTGYAEQRERADDLASKIVDVVSKPFSLPDIRRAVAQALAA